MLHSGRESNRVKTTEVKTLGELVDLATPRQPDPASGRLRENSVFRGVSDVNASLLTSLDRLGGINPPHTKLHLEEHLLRNFIRFGNQFLSEEGNDLWKVMIAAEHHGLPTRLLDWTHSPLVAAHFATLAPKPNTGRVIWKLDWKMMHRKFGLRDVAFLVEDLEPVLKEHGFNDSWEFLTSEAPPGKAFICLLDPPAFTPRLAAQSGAFTLSSSKGKPLEKMLEEAGLENALERFIIPADRVDYIRDQLDICSVDERHLFPGLDGIASELRRYYDSSGGDENGAGNAAWTGPDGREMIPPR